MSSDIKVSVCVVTYNQEKYIAECLQSLVDQITDFPFEIIVGEDCSTDNTREIVEEFARKYPDLIVRNYQAKNVGAVQNAITSYRMARGEYICHMDGDDSALPGKLQKQAMALDNNPDCVICSHNMKLLTFDGENLARTFRQHNKVRNTILDLYERLPFFAHSSKMFVNDLDMRFWGELHPQALDIEVHVQQAKSGNIYHIDEVLGIYRVNSGVSFFQNKVNPILVEGMNRVFRSAMSDASFDSKKIKRFYARAILNYAYQSALYRDAEGYRCYTRQSVGVKIISVGQLIMYVLSIFPKVAFDIAHLRRLMRR